MTPMPGTQPHALPLAPRTSRGERESDQWKRILIYDDCWVESLCTTVTPALPGQKLTSVLPDSESAALAGSPSLKVILTGGQHPLH